MTFGQIFYLDKGENVCIHRSQYHLILGVTSVRIGGKFWSWFSIDGICMVQKTVFWQNTNYCQSFNYISVAFCKTFDIGENVCTLDRRIL